MAAVVNRALQVRSGQGRKLETLLRTVRAFVIFAGSEEVMMDLGARQMVRLQKSLQDAGARAHTLYTYTHSDPARATHTRAARSASDS